MRPGQLESYDDGGSMSDTRTRNRFTIQSMQIRFPSIRETLQLSRTRDPERDALRRAIRAAIMVPVAAGFAFLVVGGRVVPLYALLGAFWLLVVTEFPGNRQQRAVAYLGLAVNGFVLITVGTLVAPIAWLAVTLMFFLGVAVGGVGSPPGIRHQADLGVR